MLLCVCPSPPSLGHPPPLPRRPLLVLPSEPGIPPSAPTQSDGSAAAGTPQHATPPRAADAKPPASSPGAVGAGTDGTPAVSATVPSSDARVADPAATSRIRLCLTRVTGLQAHGVAERFLLVTVDVGGGEPGARAHGQTPTVPFVPSLASGDGPQGGADGDAGGGAIDIGGDGGAPMVLWFRGGAGGVGGPMPPAARRDTLPLHVAAWASAGGKHRVALGAGDVALAAPALAALAAGAGPGAGAPLALSVPLIGHDGALVCTAHLRVLSVSFDGGDETATAAGGGGGGGSGGRRQSHAPPRDASRASTQTAAVASALRGGDLPPPAPPRPPRKDSGASEGSEDSSGGGRAHGGRGDKSEAAVGGALLARG
jgi:hypothetical protein